MVQYILVRDFTLKNMTYLLLVIVTGIAEECLLSPSDRYQKSETCKSSSHTYFYSNNELIPQQYQFQNPILSWVWVGELYMG